MHAIINQMQKNQPLLPASRNFFSLSRLKPDCYYPPVRVDFSSNPTLRNTTPSTPSILPAFNHDLQFFTPAFLLPSERPYYQSNSAIERNKFTQKIEAEDLKPLGECQERAQPEFQVKEGDSRYCQICQLRFQDYWQHVAEQSHARQLHLSPSTIHIRELCGEFSGRRDESPPKIDPDIAKTKRKQRKRGESGRGLKGCLSSDMLKALQENCSMHVLAEGMPLGRP